MVQVQQLQEIPHVSMKDIHPDMMIHDMVKLAQQHGPIFEFRMPFGARHIVLSSFKLVDEVCNDALFDKWFMVGPLAPLVGDGLFSARTSDPNWRKAHAILMPCFSLQAMRNYMPMMVDTAEQLIDKWRRLNPEDMINVADDMSRVTLDTIGLCGFSYHFNSLAREQMHPFVQSMIRLLSTVRERATRMPIGERLRFREHRQFQSDMDLVFATVDRIIRERQAEDSVQHNDLLHAMLTGVDKQTGERLDEVNIRYQIVTFLVAGYVTTSSLLSFALYFLLHYPAVLAKAYEEVDRVLGKDLRSSPTYEQVHQLQYLSQILQESLRLCPPAASFRRQAYQDRVLGGKYQISSDDVLTVLVPMLHRDRSVWGEAAEIFDPESHFSPEAVQARPDNAFKPFGTGQRACIGRQFALQEATLILGMILQRFLPYTTSIYQLKINEALAIKPADFFIKVKSRPEVSRVVAAPFVETPTSTAPTTEELPHLVAQPVTAHQTPLLVLYGSNAGTSEELAHRIADDGKARGFNATVDELDEYTDKLPKEGAVMIITSSYNGAPPDNATTFCQWLQNGLAKDALQGVRYTVFGVGNHEWAGTYQNVPKMIDSALAAHGAERVCQRGEGDVAGDFDRQFQTWYALLWTTLARTFGLETPAVTQTKKAAPLYEVEIVSRPHPYPFVVSFGALPMTVLENRELNTQAAGRSTRHIQIALPGSITYRSGDHLGVLASNGEAQVRRVAERFHFDRQTIIQVHATNGRKPVAPIDEPISVNDLLSDYVELQDVATRGQIARMAEYTHDAAEKQRLEKLAGTDDESTTAYQAEVLEKHRSVIDLLEECPSCALPFNIYLEFLTPLRPRYYSISSSPLVNAEECSITVGVVKGAEKAGHGVFEGMCSNYLCQQKKGNMIYAFVQNTNTPFHLPEDTRTPLIMVGPGTGIAPFRGFLQERSMQQKNGKPLGKALLFFGCRHPEHDYIYRQELEAFEQAGVTRLYTAFSRLDPQKKAYVQDGILEHKDEVWQMVQDGAIVYICGDTNRMVPDVQKAFVRLYQEQTGKDESAANAWLADLKEKNRYLVDIWGI